MTDRPILFSAPMVAALLAGRKTQTRRSCAWANNPNSPALTYIVALDDAPGWFGDEEGEVCFSAGYKPGDRLYVREAYYQRGHWAVKPRQRGSADREKWAFVAEGDPTFDAPAEFRKGRHHRDPWTVAWHKRLGRFMPRAYSRLTLIVTDVRVERLHDISEADAIAEGLDSLDFARFGKCNRMGWRDYSPQQIANITNYFTDPRRSYATLWDAINGPGAWDANPWVTAITFTVRHHNIDEAPDA